MSIFSNFPDVIVCDDGAGANYVYTVVYEGPEPLIDYVSVWFNTPSTMEFDVNTEELVANDDTARCTSAIPNSGVYINDPVFTHYDYGGGSTPIATSSPYTIDVGSTVMLGGILMFLIAYWFIGLSRKHGITT